MHFSTNHGTNMKCHNNFSSKIIISHKKKEVHLINLMRVKIKYLHIRRQFDNVQRATMQSFHFNSIRWIKLKTKCRLKTNLSTFNKDVKQNQMAAASSSSSPPASNKPTNFSQKLFMISLLLLSFSLFLVALSFKPKQQPHLAYEPNNKYNTNHLLHRPKWLDIVEKHIKDHKIKVGLKN